MGWYGLVLVCVAQLVPILAQTGTSKGSPWYEYPYELSNSTGAGPAGRPAAFLDDDSTGGYAGCLSGNNRIYSD
eukprot:scaffold45641_cov33-Prasinocladus_malaysianus.AAC.2